VFPGGTNVAPKSAESTIPFSWIGKNSKSENGGVDKIVVLIEAAGQLGLHEINSSKEILPKFRIVYSEMSFASYNFEQSIHEPVFAASLDSLGVLMFGVTFTDTAFGMIDLEKKYRVVHPKIFPSPIYTDLSDPNTAPWFNRIATTTIEWSSSYMRLFK
jgi:hypothetical protein